VGHKQPDCGQVCDKCIVGDRIHFNEGLALLDVLVLTLSKLSHKLEQEVFVLLKVYSIELLI
jgi:hypothetical protein